MRDTSIECAIHLIDIEIEIELFSVYSKTWQAYRIGGWNEDQWKGKFMPNSLGCNTSWID